MKAIILVNMGAPESEKDMHSFLRRMFRDPKILPFNRMSRFLLSEIISFFRYKKSWAKYQLIGGSPLKKSCNLIVQHLNNKNNQIFHTIAYSYSVPTISEVIKNLETNKFSEIVVVPMYPQSSFSTTGSIIRNIEKIKSKLPDLSCRIITEYYFHQSFVDFWKNRISKTIASNNLENPLLLFSAHSVPQYQIKDGDTYEYAIHKSSELIAQSLDLPFKISFQSKIGKMKWLEPTTLSTLKELSISDQKEIIIVPISFLTENLETLYDIDMDIIASFKTIPHLVKASLEHSENEIAEMLNIIYNDHAQ